MFKVIAEKEIMNNFKDLKFLLSSALVIVLMILGAFFYLDEYQRKKGEYDKNEITSWNEKSIKKIEVNLEPNPSGFIVEGKEKTLPSFLLVEPGYVDDRGGILKPISFLFNFENMDWLFIIGIIGSLIAIVFTFDAINGEKERGTLRLCLSNSISKSSFLLGKFLGVFGSLLFPLLVGLLLNLVVIISSGKIELVLDDWGRIVLVMIVGVLYISLFVFFGLLISTLSPKSSVSLVLSFLFWIMMINIIPGSSGLLANIFHPIPSPRELARKCSAIESGPGVNTDMLRPILEAPISEEEKKQRTARLSKELSIQQEENELRETKELHRIKENYNRQRAKQTEIARIISALSPYGLFNLSLETLALGGYRRYAQFTSNAYAYISQYSQYVDVLKREYRDQAQFQSRYSGSYGGFEIEIVGSPSYDQVKFDFGGFPKFPKLRVSFGEALKDSVWYIFLLILWNLLLGSATYFKFMRFDAR